MSFSIKNALLILFLFSIGISFSQNKVKGTIISSENLKTIPFVEIINNNGEALAKSNDNGYFEFLTEEDYLDLIFITDGFDILEKHIELNSNDTLLNITLQSHVEELSEVEIIGAKRKDYEIRKLKDVEGTEIYAGKKTEVILMEESMANLASNNARQIYSQVSGLNIFQNDDAGLQLNIGGRGLDPNRTSNFNTRQNGYDISADVLGYPESYYSTPAEALEEIQVVRGAASLQYGTQFGGLVNFKIKEANPTKPIELITRNTIGSYGLYTNFTSLSGTEKKFSYYSYFNYKKGDGFRPNSGFDSKNAFAKIGYQFNEKTSISGEVTYMTYLAQQAGGLTDDMFEQDPYQSNRARNWFEVNWLLYNFKIHHQFNKKTNFSFSFFGLDAERNALGFRSNRVDEIDSGEERDLIKGKFQNFGFESRLLSKYQLFNKEATFLIGTKFYKANNTNAQGPGSDGSDADFEFKFNEYPNYKNQSSYTYPNLNISVFGENIFPITKKLSITPGFRFEYINTQAEGYYRSIQENKAGIVISDEIIYEDSTNERSFVLLGVGASYKESKSLELYGNISQNYRSVTFSDISIINPAYEIDPDISDESGYTFDFGARGDINHLIRYDIGAFLLSYQNRIGLTQKEQPDTSIKAVRTNVGDAVMYGIESLIDFNLKNLIIKDNNYILNYYINTSFINSKYVSGIEEGNQVEFVPKYNIKTGLKAGYKNFLANIQYTSIADQFSDASNAPEGDISGVVGIIPAYDVLDFSASYQYKMFKLEAGVNNLLNNAYFTRRATGYPGPGIIPSSPRNYYVTLQIKI